MNHKVWMTQVLRYRQGRLHALYSYYNATIKWHVLIVGVSPLLRTFTRLEEHDIPCIGFNLKPYNIRIHTELMIRAPY